MIEALERLQTVELGILSDFARFCDKHDIKWFLESGSALGAVRHSGFIPWDDDIDVGMMRDQYEKFIAAAKTGYPIGYSIQTFSDTPGCPVLFSKISKDGTRFVNQETIEADFNQGIFIDIFPYDYLSADNAIANKQISNARKWKYIAYLYYLKTVKVPHSGLIGWIEKKICVILHALVRRILTPRHIREKFEKSREMCEGDAGDRCICFSSYLLKSFPSNQFLDTRSVKFNDAYYPVPSSTEDYLTRMYGDWQTLPPPDERRTHLPLLIDFGDGTIWRKQGQASGQSSVMHLEK